MVTAAMKLKDAYSLVFGSFNGPEPGGPESKVKERAGRRGREREKDMGTHAPMQQRYFISRNAGLYIFSKMITQLLHRMKIYQ